MKSELFAKILEIVSEITELSSELILSKTKTDELVAARCLFVHYCASLGIPSVAIAAFLHRQKVNCVNRYLSTYGFYYKSSYYFREMDHKIRDAVQNLTTTDPRLSRN